MMVVSNLMLERSPLFTLLSMISMLYFVCVWGTYLNEPEKAILWKWRRLLSLEKYRDFAVMGLMRLGMMPYEEDEEEE
jgi:hypothetical protein